MSPLGTLAAAGACLVGCGENAPAEAGAVESGARSVDCGSEVRILVHGMLAVGDVNGDMTEEVLASCAGERSPAGDAVDLCTFDGATWKVISRVGPIPANRVDAFVSSRAGMAPLAALSKPNFCEPGSSVPGCEYQLRDGIPSLPKQELRAFDTAGSAIWTSLVDRDVTITRSRMRLYVEGGSGASSSAGVKKRIEVLDTTSGGQLAVVGDASCGPPASPPATDDFFVKPIDSSR